MRVWPAAGLLAGAVLLTGCAARKMTDVAVSTPPAVDVRVPHFASRPYQAFSREEVVAIAMREWRLFGQLVDDDPPGTRPRPPPDLKPERMAGLWERVGEYWWIGQNPDMPEADWTGKHDESGTVFPAGEDANFAWSAAFISYVMRVAGAGQAFLYSPTHSDYINAAREGYGVLQAQPPQTYAPQTGDLICMGRGRAGTLSYADLPAPRFPGHCDIVVGLSGLAPPGAPAVAGQLAVIGGNVDDAVTMKHVPVTPEGLLAGPAGILDTRYPWFVVVRISYVPVLAAR